MVDSVPGSRLACLPTDRLAQAASAKPDILPELDAPLFSALHLLRIKGAASPDDLAARFAVAGSPSALQQLEAQGLIARRGSRKRPFFALTRNGQLRHEAVLAELMDDDAIAALGATYDRDFLPLNQRFKRLCADWQAADEHFDLLDDALDVHAQITQFLAEAAVVAQHFAMYESRFAALIAAVEDGDISAYVAPVGESYHNVWFELHEDLIVSLRRSRAEEEASNDRQG